MAKDAVVPRLAFARDDTKTDSDDYERRGYRRLTKWSGTNRNVILGGEAKKKEERREEGSPPRIGKDKKSMNPSG